MFRLQHNCYAFRLSDRNIVFPARVVTSIFFKGIALHRFYMYQVRLSVIYVCIDFERVYWNGMIFTDILNEIDLVIFILTLTRRKMLKYCRICCNISFIV